MKTKQTKTQRINALVAARPELTVKEVAKKLGVTPNLVHQVKWKAKQNSEFVNKVFTKAKMKQSKIIEAVQETKAAMDALEKKPEATRMSKEDLEFLRTKPKYRLASAFTDNVNHPPHYKTGGVETIDFIEAKDLNYRLGNVVKYVSRAGRKNSDPIEDLKKARWYLDREIAVRERA